MVQLFGGAIGNRLDQIRNSKYSVFVEEMLVVSTLWGNISIPIPLDEAKNMQRDMQKLSDLKAHFFIQNDQLPVF